MPAPRHMRPPDVLTAACGHGNPVVTVYCRPAWRDNLNIIRIVAIVSDFLPSAENVCAPYSWVAVIVQIPGAAQPCKTSPVSYKMGRRESAAFRVEFIPNGCGSMTPLQHNQPAAVAVATIISRLPVPHIVPARLLSILLANPLRVSVPAISLRFRITAGKRQPGGNGNPGQDCDNGSLAQPQPNRR